MVVGDCFMPNQQLSYISHTVSSSYVYSVKSQLKYRFCRNTLIASSTIKSEIKRLEKKFLFAKYIKRLHIGKILFFFLDIHCSSHRVTCKL